MLMYVVVWQMLRGMPWFASTKGTRSLAAAAMKDGSDFGTAEVITALQAAHMLVWMHEITQGASHASSREVSGIKLE